MTKKILICCGTGICTSTMANKKLTASLEKKGKLSNVSIDQCKVSEVKTKALNYDLIISTSKIEHEFDTPMIHGLPYVSGVGIDKCTDEVIKVLGL
ncbi:PTS galactitol transporter subunit IIB [Alkalibaculum sp. M08DMB]|uniref:PTS galactitol transporter subunit IIB n=1 Tax=Alkalibaculum sporogenes TaxID=2655001 RepID=A0A6A7KCC6_9FIRM|nr:PTS sugar transporter subunit IIB [Alkalibaculum sporogenes]MPW26995.1 PTS galactitol transporter subunit IIB [Alkalibaculum sporogenes]